MGNPVRFALLGILFSVCANAEPLQPEHVPEPLKPWVDWVLQDQPEHDCPFLYNSYEQKRCSWPSRLDLDFFNNIGQFAMTWKVYKDSWISLPGDSKNWPQNVSVNSKPAAVLERNGQPAIKLPTGEYLIKGDFIWTSIPESLAVPHDTGIVNLNINQQAIVQPTLRDGQLWLTESQIGGKKAANVQNSLDLQVYRKITDDVPMQVTTRLIIEVSGAQRETKLAKPLLDGFIPLLLSSPLPARIEPDGQLLIQLRPGRWQVEIVARSQAEVNQLQLNDGLKDWPSNEIWAFESRPDLRVVDIENLAPIDASQTNSPDEWRQLPTYHVNQHDTLSFKLIRRGDPEPAPNRLTLNRKLWLDFDGGGYTINDTINGTISRGWRLDALAESRLGRVSLDGDSRLITLNTSNGKQGIEIRQGVLALDADSRNEGNIANINAVGWDQSFNQVTAELNLPPGWRLFAASGVDNVPDSWLSRWTLLDIFLVLIAALAASRLFNRSWGIFTLVTLALIWHEAGAPHFIWLSILASVALVKVLPSGRFLTVAIWCRNGFWLMLAFIAIPFMINQVRTGIYPQLENPWQNFNAPVTQPAAVAPVASPEAPAMEMADSVSVQEIDEMKSYAGRKERSLKRKIMPSGSAANTYQTDYQQRYDPNAKVQTGPGLPDWQWHKVYLSWNGSVSPDQALHLWYLPPFMVMLLNFLRVALVAGLALILFGYAEKLKFNLKSLHPTWFGFVIIPLFLTCPQPSKADIPNNDILTELKSRLMQAPDCLPGCAQISDMNVTINKDAVTVNLKIQAQETVNLPLPAAYEQWFPKQVIVDGKNTSNLYRDKNSLWLALSPGTHSVVLQGATPLLSAFTLPLPLRPKHVTVNTTDWSVSGMQDSGEVENQLQFTKSSTDDLKSKLAPGILPAFVRIERTLQFGLNWRVNTRIIRLSPPDSPAVLEVPLLPGEQVTTPGLQVKDAKVFVNLAVNESALNWESNLEKTETLQLTAANTTNWIEVWQADIAPIWHIEPSGIAMIHLNEQGNWLPEWHPWPGEKLTLSISRPKSVAGQTITIDSSRLILRPGQRSRDTELHVSLRSSQGAQHTLILPELAVLQTVSLNGKTLPLRQEKNQLTIPVNPGKQELSLSWQEPLEQVLFTKTPSVNLGLASVNTRLSIGLGQDRWVLWVWGPKMGPAVLFWGVLAVIVLVAFGMGKIPLTPLTAWQWVLLLIGLSQMPIEAVALVVGWLFMLGWRASLQPGLFGYFNGVQVVIGLLTLLSLGILLIAVQQGLLGGAPNMQISGNQSSALTLNWYQDRSPAELPQATVISLPILAYRLLMLAWAFWLAASLLDWLKWGWHCFAANGIWYKKPVTIQSSVNPEKNT